MAKVLATVRLPDGAIELLATWRWQAQSGDVNLEANLANIYSADYEYSPADGRPGVRLASKIAKRLKGKVELPPKPAEPKPGTVF